MKEYTTDSIRNIAMASHGSAGKTMLAEAFLHFTGVRHALVRSRMGLRLRTSKRRKYAGEFLFLLQ
jgi:translation elongation factor EF-G